LPAVVGLITGSEAIQTFLDLSEADKQVCLVNQLKKYFGRTNLDIVPFAALPPSPEGKWVSALFISTCHDVHLIGESLPRDDGSVFVEYFVHKCWMDEEVPHFQFVAPFFTLSLYSTPKVASPP
jgi:hypothetical protein